MSNSKFPFPRLPDDICSKVLKTMKYHEIIVYSFTSKKSLSLVQSLRWPLRKARIKMHNRPEIYLDFGNITVLFKWKMSEYNEEMKTIDDIPVKVDVSTAKESQEFGPTFERTEFTWSYQKKSIGEWVKHICSIFRCECYEAEFHIFETRYEVQSLRNNFPKLRRLNVDCFAAEPNEHDIQTAQNVLRVFLPYAQSVLLNGVPLKESLSFQHIGMANLKELEFGYSHYPKLDDLLTLNVESCRIRKTRFSLRDLNRFFKMWTKGSFPKLQSLFVLGRLEKVSDWNLLLKGLNAEETENSQELGGMEKNVFDKGFWRGLRYSMVSNWWKTCFSSY